MGEGVVTSPFLEKKELCLKAQTIPTKPKLGPL